jgi:DNA/RNA-binding domain of Phe-tRNA-synthetase-like protein
VSDPPLSSGAVAGELRDEFPGLSLRYLVVDGGSGRSSRALRERLGILSDRFSGPQAVNLRNQPIPWAYRVFFRHIGLDPDVQRTPVEELALERMKAGGFKSRNRLDDALTLAVIESGVAIRALDADRVSGAPQIRMSLAGEELEGRPGELPPGTLVIADDERPLSLLFGALASGRGVGPKTKRTVLLAIGVTGVPEMAIEEALWLAAEGIRG